MTKSGKRWMTLMKKLKLILVNFIITYFTIINPIKALETISGKVRVIDGDTIVINGFFQKAGTPGKKIMNQKIRLFGIDAPEMKQICKDNFAKKYECGVKSKEFLQKLILKKIMYPKNLDEKVKNNFNVTCISKGKDRYGRILGICGFDYLGANSVNYSLNAFMVKMGHAVAYKKYSKMFENLENEAKEKSRGIWSGKFERPHNWRKKNKTKKSKIQISLPPFVIIR